MNKNKQSSLNPFKWLKSLYFWTIAWADKPKGSLALGVISFSEASFFPIPPDPLMWAFCVGKPKKSLWFAALTTLTSTLGGIMGWLLGAYFFTEIVDWMAHFLGFASSWYGTPASLSDSAYQGLKTYQNQGITLYPDGSFYQAHQLFHDSNSGFLTLFIAAFSPLPYKVFTLSAGFFGQPLSTLLGAALLGRSLRFFTAGCLFYFWGEWAKTFLERYFTLITLTLALLFLAGIMALRWLV